MKYADIQKVPRLMEKRRSLKSMMNGDLRFKAGFSLIHDPAFEREIHRLAWPPVLAYLRSELLRVESEISALGVKLGPSD